MYACNTGQSEISDQQTDYEAYEYESYEDEVMTTIGKQDIIIQFIKYL